MSSLPQFSAPNSPFVGDDGRLTFAANVFLRDLWVRVGGANASTNTDLESLIDSAQLGIFSAREAPAAPADVAYVQTFTRPHDMPTVPLADASSVICSRVFRQR